MAAKARKRPSRSTIAAESVTPGSTIRFEKPKSNRKPKPNPAVVVVQEINPAHGFANFLRDYAVITVAIGFMIAAQAQILIKQTISSFIDPLFALFVNGQTLSSKTAVVTWHGNTQTLAWGAFIYALVNFIFVLIVIYIVVKFFALDKLTKKPEDKK